MKIKYPLELYKRLNKSNCKECMLPSCMAFAVAVIKGQKKITECPHVDRETIALLSVDSEKNQSRERNQDEVVVNLKNDVAKIDFLSAAERIGAQMSQGQLAVNCLGVDFYIDSSGEMTSKCHVNPWIHIPLLHYIAKSEGKKQTGEWVSFGGLAGAAEWSNFFSHRCEDSLRQLADAHSDLVFEILHLFGAKDLAGKTNADKSLVIYPLPKVPFLINYWEQEEDFESKLNILFDRSAEENINVESLYFLGRGLVEMFRRLIVKHSKDGKLF